MSKEIRANAELEVRADEEKGERRLVGYAAVFNSRSEDLGGFHEVIQPGAFARTLRDREDIYAFVDHDSGKRIGRTKNGTLSLREDSHGLRVEIDLPNTQLGNDILEEARAGLLDAMSFGFQVRDDEFRREGDGVVRELRDVELFEVSPVSMPAYRATNLDVAQRSLEEWREREEAENEPAVKPSVLRLKMKAKLEELA